MAATVTVVDRWQDSKRVHLIGTLALTGNYATGGVSCDLLTAVTDSRPGFVPLPGISTQPIMVRIEGIAGYKYEYDKTNKKILIRQAGAVTPAGTIASTLTITKGAILASSELGLSADSTSATVNNNTIAATRVLTNPVASTFTGTATTAAPLAELSAAALPAGVTGDTIQVYAIFKLN